MTEIDWSNGITFDEAMELLYRINIDSALDPDLHARLQRGVNAGMKIAPVVQKIAPALQNAVRTMPWLTGMLHVDINSEDLDIASEDLAAAIDVLGLVKRLLDT